MVEALLISAISYRRDEVHRGGALRVCGLELQAVARLSRFGRGGLLLTTANGYKYVDAKSSKISDLRLDSALPAHVLLGSLTQSRFGVSRLENNRFILRMNLRIMCLPEEKSEARASVPRPVIFHVEPC